MLPGPLRRIRDSTSLAVYAELAGWYGGREIAPYRSELVSATDWHVDVVPGGR